MTLGEYETKEERKYYKSLLKEIIEKGYVLKDSDNDLQKKLLRLAIEKDILFIRVDSRKIIFNSQIIKKVQKRILKHL